MAGFFFSFEGGEAAGKSTQIKRLARYLRNEGHEVLTTREPGGTKFGEKLRKIHKTEALDPLSELFLIEASRARHVAQVILPAIKQGKIVLCDRFGESTLVYQGILGSLDLRSVRQLNILASQGVKPDRVFWLDLPASESLKRLKKRRPSKDRFDSASAKFHEKLRRAYQKLARTQKSPRIAAIDATRAIDEIHEDLVEHVELLIHKRKA